VSGTIVFSKWPILYRIVAIPRNTKLPRQLGYLCGFLEKFVSGALFLSGFTGGFAMKSARANVQQVKEFFYRLEQISTPLGIA
jgi:hypothetical protein